MIIVLNSLGLRGVSDVSLEYRSNCIKISQGVLLTGTVVTLRDTVTYDVHRLGSAVVDSRVLAGVLGWIHRNYLQAVEANAPRLDPGVEADTPRH